MNQFDVAIIGFRQNISYKEMLTQVAENLKSVTGAILIFLFVGALAGTWLLSGIIPAMIYYGLQLLHPTYFLAACIIICALISVATGSSWTTSATVGIALIGIGKAMGLPVGMIAGAVISGRILVIKCLRLVIPLTLRLPWRVANCLRIFVTWH